MEAAVARVAENCLRGISCPPTDLEAVGANLGITGFDAADIAGSGELRKDDSGFRIVYSNYLSPERRRFTIAHEMGHVILEKTGPKAPRHGREVERLCDLFAVELLMPRQVFPQISHDEFSTQDILETAKRFRTSIATTGLRYAELYGVSIFAYQDSRIIWGKGKFTASARCSIDEAFLPAIQKALAGCTVLDEVFLSATTSFRRWRLECRPLIRGQSVLCLLRPTTGKPDSIEAKL